MHNPILTDNSRPIPGTMHHCIYCAMHMEGEGHRSGNEAG